MFVYHHPIIANEDCERANFANAICKLWFTMNEQRLDNILDFKNMNDMIHDNIRNVYELVSTHIPLMGLYDLVTHGIDNYDFTEEEYKLSLENARNACYSYYLDDL